MSVTFALLCYNQEKFIREALRGAFRQDYQPLEILISDDHSTDASFDILREEVANYSLSLFSSSHLAIHSSAISGNRPLLTLSLQRHTMSALPLKADIQTVR